MGKYVCGACGAAHDQEPETDKTHQRILRDPPGGDDLASVMKKADDAAIKGVLKRRGVIDAYTTFFNACNDGQLAELLQHQVKFFTALAEAQENAKAVVCDINSRLPKDASLQDIVGMGLDNLKPSKD